jgi:putative nucleotidyltransferase with HDIG domain
MYKKIPIDKLRPGMHVEAIADQKGKERLKQKGHISSNDGIERLRQAGVISVIIDTARTREQSESPDSELVSNQPSSKTQQQTSMSDAKRLASFSENVSKARELYNRAKELQKQAMGALQKDEALNLDSFKEMSESLVDSLFSDQDAILCATMIRNKDEYLLEHSINVSILMAAFGRHLELPEQDIRDLALGAFLHDIGKIKVDDAILMKPGKLTVEEFDEMKRHVEYGLEAVEGLAGLPPIAREVIALHHEKLSGDGYPKQLPADDINQYGRMATIVDCYDAITANRCYKDGELSAKAFKILLAESGTHFDYQLVGQFIKCMGVFPVGSLVELKSGRLGMVLRANKRYPLRPMIKVFYNLRGEHFIEAKDIDLGRSYETDEIERGRRAENLNIDLPRFFDDFLV